MRLYKLTGIVERAFLGATMSFALRLAERRLFTATRRGTRQA